MHFAIAGGSNAAYTRPLPYEAGAAIAFGLPARRGAEGRHDPPAQPLELGDRVGSLEVDRHATVMITTGDPLE